MRKVLIVDDNEDFRLLFTTLTESLGYSALTASDGVEGWTHFLRAPVIIDLIITDLNMPNMNGLELIRRVRAHTESKAKIVAVSAGDDLGLLQAKEFGADLIVRKPFDTHVFKLALRNLTAHRPETHS